MSTGAVAQRFISLGPPANTTSRHPRLVVAALTLAVAVLFAAPPASAAPGDLDLTFSGDGKQTTDFGTSSVGNDVALQGDGKIVVAGQTISGGNDFALARYNADGSLDTTFDGDGKQTTDFGGGDQAAAVALQPDGKIIVGGRGGASVFWDFALARYNTDGSLDTTFSGDGKQTTNLFLDDAINAVALQPDGRIVAAGLAGNKFGLARYNIDGSLDTGFNPCGPGGAAPCDGMRGEDFSNAQARGVTLQPDGKIVAAGDAVLSGAGSDLALARYNPAGSLDSSFSGDGKQETDFASDDQGSDVALQTDGKILAVGSSASGGAPRDFALARYSADGSLDTAFSGDGKQTSDFGGNDVGNGVALQPDGRIVVAGGNGDFALARYSPDGSLDTSFSGDGQLTTDFGGPDRGNDVALQPDGKIVVAGSALNAFVGLARYEGAGTPPGTTPPGPTPQPPPIPTPQPPPTGTNPPAANPNAAKLNRAIRNCRKKYKRRRTFKKRAACIRKARRKYG
ncbi:MAG: hypothetical protein LC777_11945 [Actinobacteria bacterium]|nr:hypothetical protein [Actinomycetota bacterium]